MYALWVAAGLLVCFLTLCWQLRRSGKGAATALLVVALASVVGVVMAKLCYVLLLADSTLALDGIESFIYRDADTFCVFGGAAGAMLGAWLSAKLVKMKPVKMLDIFAPCGALALAFLRAGEGELGTIGAGGFVDAESALARFPFAVANAYGEHLYAVFYLEALFALACGVVMLWRGGAWREGLRTELCLFFLALPQVLCESMRMRCMKWGFVRIEQLLCALLLLALIGYACRKRGSEQKRRYLPLAVGALCVAVVGALEFALDKSGIPIWLCYVMMAVDLLCMALAECYAVKRRAPLA